MSMSFPTLLLLCSWVLRHALAAVFAQRIKILKNKINNKKNKSKINSPEKETPRQDLCLLVSKSLLGRLDEVLFRLARVFVVLSTSALDALLQLYRTEGGARTQS